MILKNQFVAFKKTQKIAQSLIEGLLSTTASQVTAPSLLKDNPQFQRLSEINKSTHCQCPAQNNLI
jgi:hypothetical protein